MSSISRNQQRRKKARAAQAIATNREKARKAGPNRHYLTPARRRTACDECRKTIDVGSALVFCADPRTCLCVGCTTARGIQPQRSARWVATRKGGVR